MVGVDLKTIVQDRIKGFEVEKLRWLKQLDKEVEPSRIQKVCDIISKIVINIEKLKGNGKQI